MNSKALVAVSLTALALFGWGCNPFQAAKEKAEKKLAEGMTESLLGKATGGDVDIDSDTGEVTFKGEDGEGSLSVGDDVKIPDDFPKHIPVYENSKALSVSISRKGNVGAWLTLTSNDDVSKITAWYDDKAEAGGWVEDSSYNMNGIEMRGYSKDNDKLSITVSPNEDSSEDYASSILLVWSQEQVSE